MNEFVKIRKTDIISVCRVAKILNECGKDMADKSDLHHWDNPYLKSLLIALLGSLRNDVYILYRDNRPIATVQTRKERDTLHLQKLGTIPSEAGNGAGSLCDKKVEELAKACGCKYVTVEVYEKSKHAISFYEKRGYSAVGETRSLKYKEIIMRKVCS